MDGYELHGHLSEQLFSAIVDCFANFSSSVGSVSEEIYSLQAVYFSYTWRRSTGVRTFGDVLTPIIGRLFLRQSQSFASFVPT